MTTTDYILNAVFVLAILRQTRARELSLRSMLIPLLVVFVVVKSYVHSIPTAGNDLVLVGALAAVGLTLGVLGGIATAVWRRDDGVTLSRVGWIAGALLIAGFGARMVFVLAVNNGAGHVVASFSAANRISAAAWPLALVAMALLEVVVRQVVVQVRAYQLGRSASPSAAAFANA